MCRNNIEYRFMWYEGQVTEGQNKGYEVKSRIKKNCPLADDGKDVEIAYICVKCEIYPCPQFVESMEREE